MKPVMNWRANGPKIFDCGGHPSLYEGRVQRRKATDTTWRALYRPGTHWIAVDQTEYADPEAAMRAVEAHIRAQIQIELQTWKAAT